MADITMPSLGADMDAGTLAEWKVRPGDRVERGTIVALVETQKATMELESFVAGVVAELLITEGTKVAVGTPIARVDGAAAAAPSPAVAAPPAAAPPERVRSSPAARKRARELEVDLRAVTPTGPHGAIVLRDVETAVRAPAPAPPAPPERPRRAPVAVTGPVRDAIAAAMSKSKREIPHYYLEHTISLRRALAWLAEANATRPIADRILPGALLLRAVARALWDVPELNGFWIDGAFRPSEEVHLGAAIALRTGGVIAPAILGDRGCEAVWGVINPPQVAMVGFGAVVDRPWAEAGAVAVHPVVTVTLAADHRVSDGHRGGLFLRSIDRILQEPPHE
jgi:pyruvate dehydrogenase E2 component (dihydrolipoamide acetyltransferase)